MSLILVQNKSYTKIRYFYFNRILRLFPIFWITAVVTFGVYFLYNPHFFSLYQALTTIPKALLIFSNVSILGQAQVYFLSITESALAYPISYLKSDIPFWQGLLVPQAWTLELELMFYCIAPFILHRKKILFSLLILSVGLRMVMFDFGFGFEDPWTYRFFPTELAFFIIGAFIHQSFLPWYQKKFSEELLSQYAKHITFIWVAFLCVYDFIAPLNTLTQSTSPFILFLSFMFLLPIFFQHQSQSRFDARIGELSYPIYICHWVPAKLPMVFWGRGFYDTLLAQFLILLVIVGIAFVLNECVSKKIETIRRQFKAKTT